MARPTLPADGDPPDWAPTLIAGINDTSDRADGQWPINTRTANYTLVAADAGKVVEMNVSTANNLTVPASVFSANQQVTIRQYGAGLTTVQAGSGMSIRCRGKTAPIALAGQYSEATITFRSGSECVLSGDVG